MHTVNRSAIADFRDARGLSLRELADQAGIDVGYLSRIETGKRNPSPAVVQAIADALVVRLASICVPGPARDIPAPQVCAECAARRSAKVPA